MCVCVCACMLVTQSCPTLQLHVLWPTEPLCPRNSLCENTGVSSQSLLQGSSRPWDCTWVFCIAGRSREWVHLIPASGKTQPALLREDRFPTKLPVSALRSNKQTQAPSSTEPTQLDRVWTGLSPGGHKATHCSRASAEAAA